MSLVSPAWGLSSRRSLGGLLDAVDLSEDPQAGAGELVEAAGVEVQRGAGEVGVAVVKPAGGTGGAGVGADRLE